MLLCERINQKLRQGWSPFIRDESNKGFARLFDVLSQFLTIKGKTMETNTMRSYNSLVRIFSEWLENNGYDKHSYVNQIDRNLATSFMLWVESNPRIKSRTYNNYLLFFRTMCNWMVEYNYLRVNPFSGIKKKKVGEKKRRTLTGEERTRLKEFLESQGRNDYLAMCLLCYYCFMRDKEIVSLTIADIDLDNQLVRVRGEIAKNDCTSYRTIPSAMLPVLRSLDLSAPADYYLFGRHKGYDFSPGRDRICERKVAKYWSDVLRPALGWGLDLQFYSLKDTGITDMANSGVPLNIVQGQADHHSLEMTSVYVHRKNKADAALMDVSTF